MNSKHDQFVLLKKKVQIFEAINKIGLLFLWYSVSVLPLFTLNVKFVCFFNEFESWEEVCAWSIKISVIYPLLQLQVSVYWVGGYCVPQAFWIIWAALYFLDRWALLSLSPPLLLQRGDSFIVTDHFPSRLYITCNLDFCWDGSKLGDAV